MGEKKEGRTEEREKGDERGEERRGRTGKEGGRAMRRGN